MLETTLNLLLSCAPAQTHALCRRKSASSNQLPLRCASGSLSIGCFITLPWISQRIGVIKLLVAFNSNTNVLMGRSACNTNAVIDEAKVSTRKMKVKKDGSDKDKHFSLDNMGNYLGKYVLSQLLQWVNGGINQDRTRTKMWAIKSHQEGHQHNYEDDD